MIMTNQFIDLCSSSSSEFGDLSKIYRYISPKQTECFYFARLNYIAVVMICREYRIVFNDVVKTSNETIHLSTWISIFDSFVINAISMISKILFYTKIFNSSQVLTWQNINDYTCDMIVTIYQISWNSLTNQWQSFSMKIIDISIFYSALIAEINTFKIATWFELNVLLTISELLFASLQTRCQHKIVRDPATTVLLFDTTALQD